MKNTVVAADTASRRSLAKILELDVRLLGMIGAFIFLCIAFNIVTDGRFLTPRNIFNLSIQTVSVAIMSMGMVFVIVTRHIDLSVGAVLAMTSALMAVAQTQFIPYIFNIDIGDPMIAPVTIIIGLAIGVCIGCFHGWLIGYQSIPAFLVTLGGLLVWRNVAWFTTTGQTIAPLDANLRLLGGAGGTLGTSLSWVVGIGISAAACWSIWRSRNNKTAHNFPVKPLWAEFVLCLLASATVLGFVAILNSYHIPAAKLARMFAVRGETVPAGYSQGYGIPISVLILIITAIVMTIVARKTRFGRYIFATGGNPEAALLAGINTRMLTIKVFALLGFLCALSAVIAQSRLQAHTNDIGTLDELKVIAAAVIGGTALSGGIGTIYGAILGAMIMQSLQSGMAMVGVDAPYQNIVVGIVLVFAVWVDFIYRKKVGLKT